MTAPRGNIVRKHTKGDAKSKAEYSPCERYRYRLDRTWNGNGRRILFVMLNPSTATEVQNDPTVERCERRARALGFGAFTVVNIFAWRATDPRDMRAAADPVGPANDASIRGAAMDADRIVAAWGNHGDHNGRGAEVERLLRETRRPVDHLGMTQTGNPKHPLYVAYSQEPARWF